MGWQGSISDYRAVSGSTCIVTSTTNAGQRLTIRYSDANANAFSHFVDGAIPPCRQTDVTKGGTGNRGVISWNALTSLKSITDGASKTLLAGEVGKYSSELVHAFNGDFIPGVWVGELEEFCEVCDSTDKKDGRVEGFGGMHSGVVMFLMCDGSVQPISKDVNMLVMDRAATRAGDDPYELDGSVEPCKHVP
jgi:prepilin-type processing-associated H-X9-DG protein